MSGRITKGRKIFLIFAYMLLGAGALLCILPFINVLAISFSSREAAAGNLVKLWPVGFQTGSYAFVLHKPEFIRSFFVSVQRVFLGYGVSMVLIILTAYPLSKKKSVFKWRNAYSIFFLITMMFSGGLIPSYMLVRSLGLLDKIWALVLPCAITGISFFYVILLMNFFRELPDEIEEAAFIDGAGFGKTLLQIYIPLSLPALATITLFVVIFHWNSWFDGLIYMNSAKNYPLQSYLQTLISAVAYGTLSLEQAKELKNISDRTVKAAQVFLTALPVLMVYPFLQKYFMSGLVLGSVKG